MNVHSSMRKGLRPGIAGSLGVLAQPMRVVLHPMVEPLREIDITQRLVSAIAEELWRLYGGNNDLNWLEAEAHLRQIVGETRDAAAVAEATFTGATKPADRRDGSGLSLGAEPAETHHRGPRRCVRRRRLTSCIRL